MVTNNELNNITNIDEHVDLINSFFILNDMEKINDTLNINDKEFKIVKNNNHLVIKCSDGRVMNLNIDFKEHDGENHGNPLSKIVIEYPFDDYKISLISYINTRKKALGDLDSEYLSKEEFLCNSSFAIQKKDTEHKLIVKDIKDGKVYRGIDSLDIFYYVEPKTVFIGEDLFYDRIRMNKEGNEITEIKGKKVPNYNLLKSFNAEEELLKINDVIDSTDFNSITIGLFDELKNKVNEKQNFINNLFRLTDIYKVKVSNILDLSEKFILGTKEKIFNSEELKEVIDYINNYSKNNSNTKRKIYKKYH